MKKLLLTVADLHAQPPASIDLDTYILTPSARTLAERLGLPFHKGGQPLDPAAAGSGKTGGPGAGDYRLVRPEFTPTGQVPRFGNPTHREQEPLRGSKAWRERLGPAEAEARRLVQARLGPGATPEAIEAGVRQVLSRLESVPGTTGHPTSNPLQPGGASPFAPPPPGGVPVTTPMVHSGDGAVTYRGNAGEVHIVLPPAEKTYLVRVRHGHARITEVPD